MDDEEHTEFNAWAAELYSRDATFMELLGAIWFVVIVLCMMAVSPLLWLANHIRRDMR